MRPPFLSLFSLLPLSCSLLTLAGLPGCGSGDDAFQASETGGGGSSAAGGVAGASSSGHGGTGTSGSGPASSSSAGGSQCAGAGDPCTDCEATKCADTYCACYDSPSCVGLAQCAVQCDPGDFACNQACWSANPSGISAGALLVDCAATSCNAACPGLMPLPSCSKCLYQQCSTAMNTCIANSECTLLLYCLSTCGDPSCQNDCYNKHPNGLADAGPVGDCVANQCAPSCS